MTIKSWVIPPKFETQAFPVYIVNIETNGSLKQEVIPAKMVPMNSFDLNIFLRHRLTRYFSKESSVSEIQKEFEEILCLNL